MKIYELPCGDEVHRFDHTIVIPFRGKRRVLSTEPYNGGYRTNLKTVFNHDGNPGIGCPARMKGKTHREHVMRTIEEIGLDLETTAGMETAAHMENVAIRTETFHELAVTAIVTGGIEVNGGRVGDPAAWTESPTTEPEYRLGTINIFLCVNTDLSEGAMARALVTCTEAKTAAVLELMAESHYSRGLATGSGTDSTMIIANMDSEYYVTYAGKHGKLGELIGKAVKGAVKQALYLQTGLCPEERHNVIKRLSRFGLSEAGLYRRYKQEHKEDAMGRAEFSEILEQQSARDSMVVNASFLAHALDQMDWELLGVEETVTAASKLLAQIGGKEPAAVIKDARTPDEAVKVIMDAFEETMIAVIKNECEERKEK